MIHLIQFLWPTLSLVDQSHIRAHVDQREKLCGVKLRKFAPFSRNQFPVNHDISPPMELPPLSSAPLKKTPEEKADEELNFNFL